MSSDSSTQSQKPVFLANTQPEQPPTLPCPRCDSINTKFCYYNNYNLSQPRHFCKSCRRYWTQGGTLRNIPVGGGTRKNSSSSSSKRPRTTTATSKTTTSSDTSSVTMDHPISATPVSTITPKLETDQFLPLGYNVDLNAVNGGFTSLLHSRGGGGSGYLALGATGGFGLGIGSGFEELGLGFGVWPEMGEGGGHAVSGGGNSGATWQIGNGCDGGFADTECYAWPELAISTPRKEVK